MRSATHRPSVGRPLVVGARAVPDLLAGGQADGDGAQQLAVLVHLDVVLHARTGDPKGPRILYFDDGDGWLTYTFVPRSEDPQILVFEIFWQGTDPPAPPPAEP